MRKPLIIGILVLIAVIAVVATWLNARSLKQAGSNSVSQSETSLQLVTQDFANPTVITSIPGDSRLYVAEQGGKVKVVVDDKISSELFIDLSDKILSEGEMGLIGLVFHPKYSDGRVFLNYIDKQQNTVISSFKTAGLSKADPSSEKILLKFAQPYKNHKGGDLHFGPDGYLYIATGDGGSGGDPEDRAQRLDNYLGKILRLDVDTSDPYAIPKDNPFVTTTNAKPEIWFYGLRNPWKFSFDSKTGDTFIADVGQGSIEEINFIAAGTKGGQNFGWRCFEGDSNFNQAGCASKDTYTFPAIEYDHSQDRCSVTGGYVYRGKELPNLQNKYIYADYCGGQIYSASLSGGTWQSELLFDTDYQISAFGEDGNSRIFFVDYASGDLYRLASTL